MPRYDSQRVRTTGDWYPVGGPAPAVRPRRPLTTRGRATVCGVALLVTAIGSAAVTDSQIADAARTFRMTAESLVTTDPRLALQFAVAADHLRPPSTTGSTVGSVAADTYYKGTLVVGPDAPVQVAAARTTAVATSGSQIAVWELGEFGSWGPAESAAAGGAVLSPGADVLVTTTPDIALWDVRGPYRPHRIPVSGDDGVVDPFPRSPARDRVVDFSASGLLAIAGRDPQPPSGDTVTLWNLIDPNHPRPVVPALSGATGPITSVAFSPDGSLLVAGGQDGAVTEWDLADPVHPIHLPPPPAGPDNVRDTGAGDQHPADLVPPRERDPSVTAMMFEFPSATEEVLAVGTRGGTLALWDVARPAQPRLLGPSAAVDSTVLSLARLSGRSRLAVGGSMVSTIDFTDPSRLERHILRGPSHPVSSIAVAGYSADQLVTGGSHGTVSIWDSDEYSRTTLWDKARSHSWGKASWFSPRDRYDREYICEVTGGGLSRAEWNRLAPDVAFEQSCPSR